MTSKNTLTAAIELRQNGKPQEAMDLLAELLRANPNDPDINYQMAWACDSMGKESEAVPYYEKAIANGLVQDRSGAMLGLGSSYRCLGEYDQALRVFEQAIAEFPEDRAFRVFRTLVLYNLGRAEEAVGQLLIQLLDTTSDPSIQAYDRALRFYSDKLNETWK